MEVFRCTNNFPLTVLTYSLIGSSGFASHSDALAIGLRRHDANVGGENFLQLNAHKQMFYIAQRNTINLVFFAVIRL